MQSVDKKFSRNSFYWSERNLKSHKLLISKTQSSVSTSVLSDKKYEKHEKTHVSPKNQAIPYCG